MQSTQLHKPRADLIRAVWSDVERIVGGPTRRMMDRQGVKGPRGQGTGNLERETRARLLFHVACASDWKNIRHLVGRKGKSAGRGDLKRATVTAAAAAAASLKHGDGKKKTHARTLQSAPRVARVALFLNESSNETRETPPCAFSGTRGGARAIDTHGALYIAAVTPAATSISNRRRGAGRGMIFGVCTYVRTPPTATRALDGRPRREISLARQYRVCIIRDNITLNSGYAAAQLACMRSSRTTGTQAAIRHAPISPHAYIDSC